MPTVLNNIGISGDYGQIVFHNDGTDNIIDLSHSNARIVTHDLSINNTLQAGQILGTKSGKVIELSGNALLVPVGTDNQRPDNASGAVGVGEIGMIRYNTTSNTFEGYGPTAWGSLGGVINTQQKTFVEAVDEHSNHDISSNSIQFTTSGELVAVINSAGNVGIGTTNPQTALQISSSSGLRLSNTTIKTAENDRIGYIDFNNDGTGAAIESCVDVSGVANNADLRFMTTLDLNNKYVERMRIDREGRVGIATTNPSEALDVSGNIIINGQIMGKGTGTGGNSATYFGLRHATPSGFTHNQILLRDNGDIYLGSTTSREISFFNGDPANRANEFMRLNNGDLILYDGDISLNNGNILATGDISLNGKLYATGDVSLNANINIGGNATIQNDLHVKNDATIDNDVFVKGSGTVDNDLHIKRHLIVDGSLSFLGEFTQRDTVITVTEQMDLSNDGTGPALIVRQHGAQPVATFYDDTTMAMIIKDGGDVSFNKNVIIDGQVGIGLTQPNGSYALDVSGNIRVSNGNQITIDAEPGNFGYFTGTDTYTVFQGNNNTQLRANNGAIKMYTNAKERLHIKSDGLIGIGTDGPTTRLDISNNTSNSVLAVRQHDLAENLAEFYNGANQVMVIDNSGSLGINRSNVTTDFALDVSGAAIVSNTLRIRDDAAPEGGELVIEGPSDSNRFHLDVTEGGHFRIFKTPNPTGHALVINNSSNFIGLNGASPAVELDISGTGALRIPVGNNGSDRPLSGANGMIRYNNTDNRYEGYDETNSRWDSLGGGSGNLETNIRTLTQGDTLFNIDVSSNTDAFHSHKVSMSDDGNRVAIVDSTVHYSHTTDATVKIYDYNVNNNQYEIKQTITVTRNGNTNDSDAEGIRGIHMTGDKNTILVVTANVTGTTTAENSDYDGSYNFIPYELTSSDPVTYTPGTSFTVNNAPWYDMDDGTTLMIAEKDATGSNRDVYFYNYSGSNKEFTLSQTIDYATDISNALPAGFDESTTAPKHVAISGNGLRALWVEEDRTNIIVFKRLSTFADFQILQTIQLNGVIGPGFTLPNLDYDGKFMAVSMSGNSGASNEIRIYAYDETKFNYVLESSFNAINTLTDDDNLGKREAHVSKDGTRLFVGAMGAENGGTPNTGAIAMLKLDKQGKVPVSSGTATAEYIAYGLSTIDKFGSGLSTDYNGKRMIGMGINDSTSNVRVIQTQEDSITMSSTYDINELKTSSGTLTLSPYNNIVNLSANVGIGTTNPQGILHLSSGGAGDCVLILESDTPDNNEYNNPKIVFKQDGGVNEALIGLANNHLEISSRVGGGAAGILFKTGNDNASDYDGLSNAPERMRIDRFGNVGIGTDDPVEALDVSGNIQIQQKYTESGNYPAGNLTFSTFNTAGTRWELGAIEAYVKANGGSETAYPGGLAFKTKSTSDSAANAAVEPATTKMVIDASGYVGIGTTNPQYTLDVSGNVSAQRGTNGHVSYFGNMAIGDLGFDNHAGIAFHRSTTYDTSYALLQTSGGQTILNSSTGQNIAFHVGNLTKMTIASDGNVGIGTTIPESILEVHGNFSLYSPDNNRTFTIDSRATGSPTFDFWSTLLGTGIKRTGNTTFETQSDGVNAGFSAIGMERTNIRFYTDVSNNQTSDYTLDAAGLTAKERMVIKNDGKIGIGKTNPSEALDVSGSISASSNLSISGNATITGNLTVNGTTTTIDTNNMVVKDSLIELSNGTTGTPGNDAGIVIERGDQNNVFMGWDESADKFIMGTTTATGASSGALSVTRGTLVSDLEGNVTVGSTQTLNVSSGTLTTSAAQNKSIIEGAASDLDIGSHNFKAGGTITSTNIGIGTTIPSEELDVSGNVRIRGTGFYIGNNFNDSLNFNHTNNGSTSFSYIDYNDNGFLKFRSTPTGGSYKTTMTLDQSGNVGIGNITTSAKLTVFKSFDGGFNGHYAARIYGTDSGIGETGIRICEKVSGSLISNQTKALDVYAAGSSKMVVTGAGNVGIGTTVPRYELDVSGSITAQTLRIGEIGYGPGHGGIKFHNLSKESYALLQTSGGQTLLNCGSGQNIKFQENNLTKMTIKGGRVGIATANPAYPLDVKGSVVLAAGSRSVYLTSGLNSAYTGTSDITIQSEYDVKATAYIATSDERIKKDILDINDDAALQKLRIIEPKTYKYKDVANRGTKTVFGFIAQQIDTVLPEAVSKLNDVIPNTYELCDATSSSNNDYYDTITFTNFNTANLDASSNNLVLVDANNKNQSVNILSVLDSSSVQVDTDLLEWMGAVDASNETVIANEVQTYKKVILDASNNVVLENYDIAPIASMDASDNVVGKMADLSGDNTIDSSNNYVDASGNFIAVVNSDGHYIDASGNYFDTNGNFMDASNNLVGIYKTEWKKVTINGTKIFVYGQHVDDFHALNKDYIFTVATAALQEVDRQLQAEKAKTATLESQVADLLARVTALESA